MCAMQAKIRSFKTIRSLKAIVHTHKFRTKMYKKQKKSIEK